MKLLRIDENNLILILKHLAPSLSLGQAQGGMQEPAARVIDLELSEPEIGKETIHRILNRVEGGVYEIISRNMSPELESVSLKDPALTQAREGKMSRPLLLRKIPITYTF